MRNSEKQNRVESTGIRTLHGKMDRCRESRGWATACSRSMPERNGKDQGKENPKQACSCWFARHSWLTAASGANLLCTLWEDVVFSFSGVTFVWFSSFLKKNLNASRPSAFVFLEKSERA